jgi:prophage regulatory protein
MNAQPSTMHSAIQILRLPQVCQVTGLCRSMVYQMEAEDRFPRRIKIGTRAVGWLQGEVQAWLAARVDLSRPTPETLPRCPSPRH